MFGKLSPRLPGARAVRPSFGGVVMSCLRLYATSGTPVPSSDVTTVSTLYVGPFEGNVVTMLDGADNLVNFTVTEVSLALTGLTSGKPYDVFVYSNGGALVIELSAAWASDTSRTDAVVLVKGLYVKSADHTRLHVGTIYTTGTTSTSDTETARYIWNRYNQRRADMRAVELANSWTYTTNTFRQANNSTANQLNYVTGDASTVVEADAAHQAMNANVNVAVYVGIGIDSTSTAVRARWTQWSTGTNYALLQVSYRGKPGLGKHAIVWLEKSATSGANTNWYGDAGEAFPSSGIVGVLWN